MKEKRTLVEIRSGGDRYKLSLSKSNVDFLVYLMNKDLFYDEVDIEFVDEDEEIIEF